MCKYVVVDLEMCIVPSARRTNKFHWKSETVQIGAVLLDENLEIADYFATYVAPQYGYIDDYINKLTDISQGDVVNAPVFEEALTKFIEWIPHDSKVVSWSNNDKLQICREIEAKDVKINRLEGILKGWIDCQKVFGDIINSTRCYKLSEALVAADIMYEDGAHDGRVDAYNTALLFAKMKKEQKLRLNTYYQQAISEEDNRLSFTLGNIFKGLDLQEMLLA